MIQRTVEVWGERFEIALQQDANTLWVAKGLYKGQPLEVKDKTELAAIKRWQDTARKKRS